MDLTFLICTERSGSNLITRMLDSHPEICGPPPSHVARTFAQNLLRYGDLAENAAWRALTDDISDLLTNQLGRWQTHLSGGSIRAGAQERSLGAAIRFLYESEAGAQGKRSVFIKENQTHRFLPFLLCAFPKARFLYLVRDPRDMALSWKRSANHPGEVRRGAHVWQRDQQRGILCYGFLKSAGKILLLRYEDLIELPEREMQAVCAFLDLPYSPEMLQFHDRPSTLENAARLKDWENLVKPVMSANKQKYRAALSELEIRYVEALCKAEMEFLAYPLEFPAGDPDAFEEALQAQEGDAPGGGIDPGEEEAAIRQRRLAVLRRILSRRLVR